MKQLDYLENLRRIFPCVYECGTSCSMAYWCVVFARDHLNGPLPEAEFIIAQNALCSYDYAVMTQKSFPLGEEAIAQRAILSCLYAQNVLKGRFKAGEEVIRQSEYWDIYARKYGLNDDV